MGWILASVAAIAALAAADRGLRSGLARGLVETGEARWIWDLPAEPSDDPQVVPRPSAFYALDSFDLASRPPRATLQIVADEEYIVWLNGRLVGTGAYTSAGSIDEYEVAPLLVVGQNWVVAELRSRRDVGGLLCRLHSDGTTLSASGDGWRVETRYVEGDLDAAMARGEVVRPHVWGAPPTGRWGYPREVRSRPTLDSRLEPSGPLGAVSWRRRDVDAWRSLRDSRARPVALGEWVTFDWGRPVEGHLGLYRLSPPDGDTQSTPALVLLGLEPPNARAQAATGLAADEVALFLPDSPYWLSARSRRFRYATVLGLSAVSGAEVYGVAAGRREGGGDEVGVPVPVAGVFGLTPPLSRTPIEYEVRSELENVLGVAAR